jgi:hypothetical protein
MGEIPRLSKYSINKGFGDFYILINGSFFSGFSKGLNRGIFLFYAKIGEKK